MVRAHPRLALFTVAYLVGFLAYGLAIGSDVAVPYVVLIVLMILVVCRLDRRSDLGGGVLWGLAVWGLRAHGRPGRGRAQPDLRVFATLILPETNVGGYINTGWDLVFNLAGGIAATIWLVRCGRRSPAATGPAGPG